MTIRPETDDLIDFLNSLLTFDRYAIGELLIARVPCNEVMRKHPTVQVSGHGTEAGFSTIPPGAFRVGLLGILNGYCGIIDDGERRGWGPITAVYEDGRLERFIRTDSASKSLSTS